MRLMLIFLAEPVSISVNSGGSTLCCMDADVGCVRFAAPAAVFHPGSHRQRLVQDWPARMLFLRRQLTAAVQHPAI